VHQKEQGEDCMSMKPQLVLDLAGVLVSNFSSSFLLKVSENSDITVQEIREQFDEVRKDLWTGKINEEEFWEWLRERNNRIKKEEARKLLIESLVPLPAVSYLAEWRTLLADKDHKWIEEVKPMII